MVVVPNEAPRMPLIEEFESTGHWLFRWRSYLPLATVAFVLGGIEYFNYPYGSHLLDELWEVLCLMISFSGLAVRALTIGYATSGTAGRNTKGQVAADLNTTGMYSIIRNPLYMGNFLMVLGVMLFLRVWWIPVIYMLVFALYYERIIFAEEKFLRNKFSARYMDWASQTPAFLPRFNRWQAPELPFRWRKVLRREYHGLIAIASSMFLLEAAGDLYLGHGFEIDTLWAIFLPLAFGSYLVIRFLHKRTGVLREK
jgi:protein-S-isoprenylcysteine O-methyltransferase Ste14